MGGKHLTQKQLRKLHFDAPTADDTKGCVWRVNLRAKQHTGASGSNSHGCNHAHNSYLVCKDSGVRPKYHASNYRKRLDEVDPGEAEYQKKSAEAKKRADALKSQKGDDAVKKLEARAAAATGAEKARLNRNLKILKSCVESAKKFTQQGHFDKYFKEVRGAAVNRLVRNPDNAWIVGAIAPKDFLDADYLRPRGLSAGVLLAAGKVTLGGYPPNHDDAGPLGQWYPYDHEHHHVVPVGSMKTMINSRPQGKATPPRRLAVLVKSGWNINARENVLLLATDITVAKVIDLPAHCPWGAFHHKKYSNIVDEELKGALSLLNAALKTAQGDPHEVTEEAAIGVVAKLKATSKKLLGQIDSGAFGSTL